MAFARKECNTGFLRRPCDGLGHAGRKIVLFAMPADEQGHSVAVDGFHEEKWMHPSFVTVEPVNFGPVTGLKRIRRDGEIVVSVEYALAVPGGYVSVALGAKEGVISAAEVEKCFHTIRLIPH